jgi:hypothetical protein
VKEPRETKRYASKERQQEMVSTSMESIRKEAEWVRDWMKHTPISQSDMRETHICGCDCLEALEGKEQEAQEEH